MPAKAQVRQVKTANVGCDKLQCVGVDTGLGWEGSEAATDH